MASLSSRSLDTGEVLRAIAILAVVCNHSTPVNYRGGMTFLLMLSGYNFARFAMATEDGVQIRNSALRMAWDVFWPSFLWVMFWFATRRQFNIYEFLFVRNFIGEARISVFPVWYVQMLMQMLFGMAMVFSIRPLVRWFFARPLLGSSLVFGLALLLRWGLAYSGVMVLEKLPHLMFWNFTLGWVLHYASRSHGQAWRGVLATVAVLGSSWAVWGFSDSNFYSLAIGGLLLYWTDSIRMPSPLARVVGLVGQATFTIFLCHRAVFLFIQKGVPMLDHPPIKAVIAAVLTLSVWMAMEAARRAVRSTPHERLPWLLRKVTSARP